MVTDVEILEKVKKASKETCITPSESQKEFGNYAKGRFSYEGLTFIIENPEGSFRQGVSEDGIPWKQRMNNAYGYFGEAKGVDKDKLDFFIGPQPVTGSIFVVSQNKEDGTFDEHKIMFGFPDIVSAKQAYLSNYSPDWRGFRSIRYISLTDFKEKFIKHSSSLAWLEKYNWI